MMNSTSPILCCNLELVESHPDCDCYLLKSFIKDDVVLKSLANEVNSLPFSQRANDLHCLCQTEDFSEIKNLPELSKSFVQIMKTEVRRFVERAFGVKTQDKMTMTGSMYNKGDYLLCHDDLCSDRLIAFVFYLSDNWTEADGGSLRFFQYNEDGPISEKYRKTFVPIFNSLVIFRVSKHSFHEVQEVLGDKARLSINGWFHGFEKLEEQESQFVKAPFMEFTDYISDDVKNEVIQLQYQKNHIRKNLKFELEGNLLVLGANFLNANISKASINELKNTTQWQVKGSPLYRKYEALSIHLENSKIVLPEEMPNTQKIVDFLVSQYWQIYLNDVTGLEFAVINETCVPPVCVVEIQKWKEGSYSIVTDNDVLRGTPTIEVIAFLQVDEDIIQDNNATSPPYNGCLVRLFGRKFSKKTYKKLYSMKFEKVKSEILNKKHLMMFAEDIEFNRGLKSVKQNSSIKNSISNKDNKRRNKLKRLLINLERNRIIIQRKLMRIEQYRKNFPQESNVIVPKTNSLLIAINSHNSGLFTSYIRHTKLMEANPCIYCINVTYLVTSSPGP